MKRSTYTITITIAFTIYIVSYALLSSQGEYVLTGWGLAWVKSYDWAPRGFVSGEYGIEQNRITQRLFMPLWIIDKRLIHTSAMAESGGYPVNTRLNDELQAPSPVSGKATQH